MNLKQTFFIVAIVVITAISYKASAQNFYDVRELPGHYEMKIIIGGREFTDLLELKTDPAAGMLRTCLTGTLTVPGSFTAALTGSAQVALWAGTNSFHFEITAHENGHDFKVYYFGSADSIDNLVTLKGTAYLDPDKKQLLGPFTAVKKNE